MTANTGNPSNHAETGVVVSTGCRLHFGPLSYGGGDGPQFGGVGVMLESPGFEIRLAPAERDAVAAPEAFAGRIRRLLTRWRETERRSQNAAIPVAIEVVKHTPAHSGLGSGTQLALAVGRGLAELSGREEAPAEEIATRLGRGRRSAVGVHGFERGGFLVDAGKRPGEDVGGLAARCAVPSSWRFVLIVPEGGEGLAGQQEEAAFAGLAAMPAETSGRLCRLALTELLPAVRAADCARFGAALDEYGTAVGEFFAPVQGGCFAHPLAGELADWLRKQGFAGVAQSSWGPTLCVVVPGSESAEECRRMVLADERFGGCRVHVSAGRNRPASTNRREREPA